MTFPVYCTIFKFLCGPATYLRIALKAALYLPISDLLSSRPWFYCSIMMFLILFTYFSMIATFQAYDTITSSSLGYYEESNLNVLKASIVSLL